MPPDWPEHELRVRDVVEMEDDRRGTVIGFYRGEPEMALVLLACGERVTVPTTAPRLIDRG